MGFRTTFRLSNLIFKAEGNLAKSMEILLPIRSKICHWQKYYNSWESTVPMYFYIIWPESLWIWLLISVSKGEILVPFCWKFFPLSAFDIFSRCSAASPSKLFSATFSEAAELTASMTSMDPDPDPHVFGPLGSGSGSTSQRYGSGTFYHHAKIGRKTLIPTILWLFLTFYLEKMMYM